MNKPTEASRKAMKFMLSQLTDVEIILIDFFKYGSLIKFIIDHNSANKDRRQFSKNAMLVYEDKSLEGDNCKIVNGRMKISSKRIEELECVLGKVSDHNYVVGFRGTYKIIYLNGRNISSRRVTAHRNKKICEDRKVNDLSYAVLKRKYDVHDIDLPGLIYKEGLKSES